MFEDVSILVATCKEYSPLWDPLIDVYNLLFEEYKGKFYFSCSQIREMKNLNKAIFLDPEQSDLPWSHRVINILKKVNTKLVLFICEDYFLSEKVNTEILNSFVQEFSKNKRLGYIKLFEKKSHIQNCIKKDYNDFLFEEDKKSSYRLSCQASLYKKEFLLKLLRKSEGPWIFEGYASYRTRFYRDICLCYKGDGRLFNYYEGYFCHVKRINQEIKEDIEKNTNVDLSNLKIDFSNLKIEKKEGFIKKIYHKFYLRLSAFFPFLKY